MSATTFPAAPTTPAALATPLVSVENLTVDFALGPGRRTRAVDGVSFTVHSGQCVAIVGESGSGKSVTARTLLGLTGPRSTVTADRLEIDGEDATALSEPRWRTIRGGRIGMVLQDALVSLDPLRTVGAEIAEVLRTHQVVPRARTRERTIDLLTAVGVPRPDVRAEQYPHQLSGGLRQRALIASAIAGDPRLIIADEPTTALDVTVQAQVLDTLAARVAEGSGLLLISHDLAVVAGIADHVLVMRDGVVVESGPTAQVLGAPREEYTRSLLTAVPSASSRGFRLVRPSAVDAPGGGANGERATTFVRERLPQRTPDASDVVLQARHLTRSFANGRHGRHVAVDDVSFQLGAGETLGIVGESGSGKSTLVNLVLGFLEPEAGEVLVRGEAWSPQPERARRPRRGLVQLISQDPLSSFDPRWTVDRVIAESTLRLGLGADESRSRAVRLLRRVGLDESVLARHPRSLSGGQRQRVAIARALAPEPQVLVCDEPTSALDVSVQAQVLDLLAEIQADRGTSLVFVSHDLGVVHHVADRVLVLQDARVVEEGAVDDVLSRPGHEYTRRLVAALPAAVGA
ncbi:dipeptide ABC transporter ATP-binding protein [Xylanimonas protaetiae]|uniref:ABC transporter ATP-binding protein n=1 Tax=Xylanimonas protaetiae TaxID=2509457 RepID=A0A4P6F7V4_9MICO|nr:ABC transporter ATP-binding protein [Xylanimonas protaetiae]QAY71595.1 ABC transporter ATP-binding protein [Xylanimonas protaetiae]